MQIMPEPGSGDSYVDRGCVMPKLDAIPASSLSGYRNDELKPRWDLLPSDALEAVVMVLTAGARKYEPRNWEKGMNWSRCFASIMRHAWAWWRGENRDPESGISHMAHVACNAMFLCSYEERGMKMYDDRERLEDRDFRALLGALHGGGK